MKNPKKLTIHYILFLIISTFLLLTGCVSTENTSALQVDEVVSVTAADLNSLPEIKSVKAFPPAPDNLPGISYSLSLSDNPLPSDLKNIFVVSPKAFTWKPEEDLLDVYVYEKASERYVACLKNCYRESIFLGQWWQLSNVWRLWSKDDAVYFISPSNYVLTTKDGQELISGYLAETAFSKVRINLNALSWQPEGETTNLYLYSKKEQKYVAYITGCWRNTIWCGVKGWGGNVKNAYQIITTDNKEYLVEASDYCVREVIDDVLIDAFSPDIKVSLSSYDLEAGKKITVSATGVKNKYLFIYGSSADKKTTKLIKTLEGGENRKTSIIIPFSSDKILITFSNQKKRWVGTCYESSLINKPVKNGRVFQIPSSYEKANQCRKSKPDQRIRELANDPELEDLRLTDQDAYLDEVINRINKMGFDNYGKVTAIHDFIAYLVCYDHDSVYEKYEVVKNGKVTYEERSRKESLVKTFYKDVVVCKKTSCAGYSALFYEMCCRADIVCEIVNGYARGYLWKPDDDVEKTNHAWNAVLLDGGWYLIDNTWDAGKESDGVRKVNCEHTWLFAPPEEFYPKHLPLNPELQLLKKPVTAAEFRNTKPTYPKL